MPATKETEMQTMSGRNIAYAVAVAALLAAILVVLPVAALAKGPGRDDQAWFKATLSGSQVTTWEYRKENLEEDPCDASSHGNGSQMIRFRVPKTFRILFQRPLKGQEDLFGTNGRPFVALFPFSIFADATAEREGDYTVNYGEVDRQRCSSAVGGGGGGPIGKDCGTREGVFRVDLFFHNRDFGDLPMVPGSPDRERNRLTFAGDGYQWSGPNGGALHLGGTYANCPFLLRDALSEDAGRIFADAERLSERRLFRRGKRINVSGHEIVRRNDGLGGSGQTIMTWNLRLTRVKTPSRYIPPVP